MEQCRRCMKGAGVLTLCKKCRLHDKEARKAAPFGEFKCQRCGHGEPVQIGNRTLKLCKNCRDRDREYQKAYREANPEKKNMYQRRYCETHRDKVNEYERQFYHKQKAAKAKAQP